MLVSDQRVYPSALTAAQSEVHDSANQNSEIVSTRSTDPQLMEDQLLVDHGDYSNAAKSLLTYLSKHADSADAHFLLGYVFYRENKPKDSLAEYTEGAHLRKPDANDLAVVAMDYILLSDYPDADKWLTLATSWSPGNALYWYYLGRTKYSENRFQEAVDAFRKCLTLHPRDVRAEYNLGLSYAGLDRNDDARNAYQTAIAWQENALQLDPQPYLDLGMLLRQQGHPEEALPDLQKAAQLDPQNPRAHEELGRAYEQSHDLASAASEFEKAISLAPDISALHFELGRIYQKEGLASRAKEEFARSATLNATHSTDSAQTPNPVPRD
jgi:Flp pilus assembly protein TadD